MVEALAEEETLRLVPAPPSTADTVWGEDRWRVLHSLISATFRRGGLSVAMMMMGLMGMMMVVVVMMVIRQW